MRAVRVLFLLMGIIITSCQKMEIENQSSNSTHATNNQIRAVNNVQQNNQFHEGILRVKLSRRVGDTFRVSTSGLKAKLQSNIQQMNHLMNKIQATDMERLFPYAGKYEPRTRKEGLHLWYVIKFNKGVKLSQAVKTAQGIDGIDIIERVPRVKLFDAEAREATYPFNDEFLPKQWHFHNTGTLPNAIKGADINMFKAWEIEKGKANVIVNVVDGGIIYKQNKTAQPVFHDDLINNMHVNEAEKNGVEGVDDDNNGYVDDIYGYNFFSNTGEIYDNNAHATHVSGCVAATNNNNLGVCGVAGGDGSQGSGVRIINSQVFLSGKGSPDDTSTARAIKYGADNGAVISQNSWGYADPLAPVHKIHASDKEAIDYFIKYAGCDNNGNQLPDSPMKGGILIFAAGNEATEYDCYPAAYDKVVSVAAMGVDFTKASYSNWGKWVDITAPGGDGNPATQIFSLDINNDYRAMLGTSMACPLVSGVAALIVSKYGGQGFTNEECRTRLLGGLRPFNIDELNPTYAGKMGLGYIDAYKALAENKSKAPKTPKFTKVEAGFRELDVQWLAVDDEDDGMPSYYKLYYSTKELTKNNYKKAEYIKLSAMGRKVGAPVNYLFENLDLETKYYFAIEATDRWGLTSSVSFTSKSTKENHAPIIKNLLSSQKILLTGLETAKVELEVEEPDGQDWSFEVEGNQNGLSAKREGDKIILTFRVVEPMGRFLTFVKVKDIFGAGAEVKIPFEYFKNSAPILKKEISKTFIPIKTSYTINLDEYFSDPEQEGVSYKLATKASQSMGLQLDGSKLVIMPKTMGRYAITVVATDPRGESSQETISIQSIDTSLAKNGELVYLVYPIPARKKLNLQIGNDINDIKLTIRSSIGKRVLEQNVKIVDNKRHIVLDIAKLSTGSYVLIAEAKGKKYEKPFVKF